MPYDHQVGPATFEERAELRALRERAGRRVPVEDGGRPVGVLSIGDLAMERDERSALADISAERPNT